MNWAKSCERLQESVHALAATRLPSQKDLRQKQSRFLQTKKPIAVGLKQVSLNSLMTWQSQDFQLLANLTL
tara:strand:- start:160 stop:372 length:213 start_codon:yes stop_codon:yes gene_type:complete